MDEGIVFLQESILDYYLFIRKGAGPLIGVNNYFCACMTMCVCVCIHWQVCVRRSFQTKQKNNEKKGEGGI